MSERLSVARRRSRRSDQGYSNSSSLPASTLRTTVIHPAKLRGPQPSPSPPQGTLGALHAVRNTGSPRPATALREQNPQWRPSLAPTKRRPPAPGLGHTLERWSRSNMPCPVLSPLGPWRRQYLGPSVDGRPPVCLHPSWTVLFCSRPSARPSPRLDRFADPLCDSRPSGTPPGRA